MLFGFKAAVADLQAGLKNRQLDTVDFYLKSKENLLNPAADPPAASTLSLTDSTHTHTSCLWSHTNRRTDTSPSSLPSYFIWIANVQVFVTQTHSTNSCFYCWSFICVVVNKVCVCVCVSVSVCVCLRVCVQVSRSCVLLWTCCVQLSGIQTVKLRADSSLNSCSTSPWASSAHRSEQSWPTHTVRQLTHTHTHTHTHTLLYCVITHSQRSIKKNFIDPWRNIAATTMWFFFRDQ